MVVVVVVVVVVVDGGAGRKGSRTQRNVDDNDEQDDDGDDDDDDKIVEPVSGLTDCATASTVIDMKNLASAASAARPPTRQRTEGRAHNNG